jgi:hypothetical protein
MRFNTEEILHRTKFHADEAINRYAAGDADGAFKVVGHVFKELSSRGVFGFTVVLASLAGGRALPSGYRWEMAALDEHGHQMNPDSDPDMMGEVAAARLVVAYGNDDCDMFTALLDATLQRARDGDVDQLENMYETLMRMAIHAHHEQRCTCPQQADKN